jgi:hypothetical protein
MPLAKNLSAYEDLRPHFDRALVSPRGIRITVASSGAAVSLRSRLYALRKLEREASIDVYDPGDLRRGTSPYENLAITIEDNAVLITPRAPPKVEDL